MNWKNRIVAAWIMILLIVCSFTGCMPNRQWRGNILSPATNKVDPHTQDRFVPSGLESNFVDYINRTDTNVIPLPHQQMDAQNLCTKMAFQSTRYFLGFIEFDDYGELWFRSTHPINSTGPIIESPAGPGMAGVNPRDQFIHAINLIRYAKQVSERSGGQGRIRLVVFIHGWKNNASHDSGNVWGFRHLLNCLTLTQDGDRGSNSSAIPVVGIYIGWRGGLISAPILKEFSYWNRRNTARLIPGSDLLYTLLTLSREAKRSICMNSNQPASYKADNSPVILIGHSFGGLILERAISEPTIQYLLDHATAATADPNKPIMFPPLFDRIILVNSAAPASEAHQLLSFLQEHNVRVWLPATSRLYAQSHSQLSFMVPSDKQDSDRGGLDTFLFLAMTSSGDAATHVIMPIANRFDLFRRSTHIYFDAARYEGFPQLSDQSTWMQSSVANIPSLQTHEICKPHSNTVQVMGFTQRFPLLAGYDLCANGNSTWNHTSYWAIQVPKAIIPDHGNIFTEGFVELIAHISGSIPASGPGEITMDMGKPAPSLHPLKQLSGGRP